MKEFWYDILEDYITKADNYGDPKTIKLYEIVPTEEKDAQGNRIVLFRAVTYLRTALIGFRQLLTEKQAEDFSKKLKEHGHSKGQMVEVAPLKM